MKMVPLLLCGLLAWPVSISAQSQSERFARLLSQDFAQSSREHLSRGERADAIIAALRGLPEDPTASDMETYEEAYDALLTATVSRSVQLPMTLWGMSAFGPMGQRVVTIGGQWGAEAEFDRAEPLTLWNAVSGKKIAKLLDVRDTTTEDVGPGLPVFSPDGQYIAISSDVIDQVILFSAKDGREIWRQPANRTRHVVPAFSADSTRLITGGQDPSEGNTEALQVFDVASGQVLSNTVFPSDGCAYGTVSGGMGNAVYFFRSAVFDNDQCFGGQRRIFAISSDETGELINFDHVTGFLPDLGVQLNQTAQLALVATESYDTIVVDRRGNVVAHLTTEDYGDGLAEFNADGTRLIAPRYGETDAIVGAVAFDLSGNRLDSSVEDHLGFAHAVHYPSGELHSLANEETQGVKYTGADLPRGVQLYDYVWQQLPEPLRASINDDRVARP